jgi:sensor histidine kinase YesM
MWKRIVAWHRHWEDQQLKLLEDPAHAAAIPAGWRRDMADKVGKMSPVERAQLRDFQRAYRGWRGHLASLKVILLFTLAGVAWHLLFPAMGLGLQIAIANAIGVAGGLSFTVAYFGYRKMAGKSLRITVTLVACASVLALVFASQAGRASGTSLVEAMQARWLTALLLGAGAGLLFAVPMAVVGALRNQQYQALTAKLELEAERHRAARELSESQLRLLHAQIEPHFLFNTLGAVQQLAEKGAPRAAELTANLIAFLRASLAEMRTERVNLRGDFGLIRAYLDVMKARLGTRLDYSLHLPDALAGVGVPSMMLLTLVENAIKHGIEPALRGGTITVAAERLGGQVRIRVQDSGVGMSATPGHGHGLENVRARLALSYGAAGSLILAEGEPHGLVADIVIPIDELKA